MINPIENPQTLAARLVVCHGVAQFGDRLQNQLRSQDLDSLTPLVESCDSLEECRQLLCQWPASLVFVMLPEPLTAENFPQLLGQISDQANEFPQARCVVLFSSCDTVLAEAFREAGAAAVVDWQQNERILALILRHLKNAPRQELSLRQEFLSRVS